jgi:cell pole-organizing protein PopZ
MAQVSGWASDDECSDDDHFSDDCSCDESEHTETECSDEESEHESCDETESEHETCSCDESEPETESCHESDTESCKSFKSHKSCKSESDHCCEKVACRFEDLLEAEEEWISTLIKLGEVSDKNEQRYLESI